MIRIIWFESIIKNDHEMVKHLICNGQDVNMRAGPEDVDLFTFYYATKCKSNTVFFDCCNLVEAFRPNGAHVAIFFNSKECLRHICIAQVFENVFHSDFSHVDIVIHVVRLTCVVLYGWVP